MKLNTAAVHCTALSDLGGVNLTILEFKLFQNGLNFSNLKCKLVEVSNMGLLYTFLTLSTSNFVKLEYTISQIDTC